jgi:hypothetical protein
MHHVSDAFLVSATAIIAAMVATFVEKMLVTALYRKAEELTFELDSMFESGAGEEYLARLVKASEDSADQSKMLKDALVTDLDRILTSLTDRQIQAQAQGSQDLANQFIQGLTVGLQGPLERIAAGRRATGNNRSPARRAIRPPALPQ